VSNTVLLKRSAFAHIVDMSVRRGDVLAQRDQLPFDVTYIDPEPPMVNRAARYTLKDAWAMRIMLDLLGETDRDDGIDGSIGLSPEYASNIVRNLMVKIDFDEWHLARWPDEDLIVGVAYYEWPATKDGEASTRSAVAVIGPMISIFSQLEEHKDDGHQRGDLVRFFMADAARALRAVKARAIELGVIEG
jgi:hypothetical protein